MSAHDELLERLRSWENAPETPAGLRKNLTAAIQRIEQAASSATEATSLPVEAEPAAEEVDELGKYDSEPCEEGITLRRQWWSGGTWLEKGDRVVVLRPRMKGGE